MNSEHAAKEDLSQTQQNQKLSEVCNRNGNNLRENEHDRASSWFPNSKEEDRKGNEKDPHGGNKTSPTFEAKGVKE